MGQIFKIREIERDDELGIVEKEVSSNNGTFRLKAQSFLKERTDLTLIVKK